MQGAGNAKLSLVPLPETSDYPVAKVVKKQQIRNRNDHTILKLSGFLYGCRLYIFLGQTLLCRNVAKWCIF